MSTAVCEKVGTAEFRSNSNPRLGLCSRKIVEDKAKHGKNSFITLGESC
jgi:hypothetical protein